MDDVLESYAESFSVIPAFLMPGCGFKHRRREKSRREKKHNAILLNKEVNIMPRGNGTGPQGKGPKTGRGQGKCKAGKGGVKGQGRSSEGDQRRGVGQNKGQGRNATN